MSQIGKSDDQSMEEILASIRSTVDDRPGLSAKPTLASAPPLHTNGGAAEQAGRPSLVNDPSGSGAPQNGTGRLRDALSQIADATTAPAPPPTLTTQPSAPPHVVPDAKQKPDDDLADLFEEATASQASPTMAVPNPAKSSSEKFGLGASDSQNVSLGALSDMHGAHAGGPALANPASSAAPDRKISIEVKPQKDNTNANAGNNLSEEARGAAPSSNATDAISPQRKPNFDALKALASDNPLAQGVKSDDRSDQGVAGAAASSAPSAPGVLLPQMRDIAKPANPVAEMHAMAAAMSQSASRSQDQTVATSETTAPATLADDEVPTEIVGGASTTSPNAPSGANPVSIAKELDTPSGLDGDSGPEGEKTEPRTLEDVVVDILKPQLKQWLESNMPRIVERALRAEQTRTPGKDRS